jgi:uncharacterized membrane protein YdfJ with MMPL/SSD domain
VVGGRLARPSLTALAVPALQMRIVTSGVEQLSQDLPIIQTYNKVKAVFPKEGITATVVVEADNVRSGPVAAGIAALGVEVRRSDAFLPGTEIVLIDATIIGGVLLPASMKLPGDWDWYLPRWLECFRASAATTTCLQAADRRSHRRAARRDPR